MTTTRTAAAAREAARLMRGPGCPVDVLRALRTYPLTPTELAWVFRGQWKRRTIYVALEKLRLTGLAIPTRHKLWCLGGYSRIWKVI